jgi:hypothetical protein
MATRGKSISFFIRDKVAFSDSVIFVLGISRLCHAPHANTGQLRPLFVLFLEVPTLFLMRSDCKPYLLAPEACCLERIRQSLVCRIQHATTGIRQLISRRNIFGVAGLKECEQPPLFVVWRGWRVLFDWQIIH